MKLTDVVELKSGTPQFRLIETSDPEAPVYCFYGQQELEADLTGMGGDADCAKRIRTHDAVEVLSADDLVFSLMSGKSCVSERASRRVSSHAEFLKARSVANDRCSIPRLSSERA